MSEGGECVAGLHDKVRDELLARFPVGVGGGRVGRGEGRERDGRK